MAGRKGRRNLDYTEGEIVEMARLYRNGLSTLRIGKRFGCLGGSVWARIKGRVEMRDVNTRRFGWSITSHGYVTYGKSYLHRIVAAAWRGWPLEGREIVHHKNGDKIDNRPSNLEIMEGNGIHMREHHHYGPWHPEGDWIIARSRDAGATAAGIATALGVTVHSVNNRVHRLIRRGLLSRLPGGHTARAVPTDVMWSIREMEDSWATSS